MFKWCKKIISLHKLENISQTIHSYIFRHCGRGSASLCKVHSSARFRMDCPVTAIVVDLTVQRLGGDDPGGRAPPLKRVWSFHTSLDLFTWSWFAILCWLTYLYTAAIQDICGWKIQRIGPLCSSGLWWPRICSCACNTLCKDILFWTWIAVVVIGICSATF